MLRLRSRLSRVLVYTWEILLRKSQSSYRQFFNLSIISWQSIPSISKVLVSIGMYWLLIPLCPVIKHPTIVALNKLRGIADSKSLLFILTVTRAHQPTTDAFRKVNFYEMFQPSNVFKIKWHFQGRLIFWICIFMIRWLFFWLPLATFLFLMTFIPTQIFCRFLLRSFKLVVGGLISIFTLKKNFFLTLNNRWLACFNIHSTFLYLISFSTSLTILIFLFASC